jgi:L-threonylcarbamoyladenylate synthase
MGQRLEYMFLYDRKGIMITSDIALCADVLSRGKLVAFPTETVFGLGARADVDEAVSKIFELKERPKDHPLIAHHADVDMALSAGKDIPAYARQLAEKFWPGPMTLVFRKADTNLIGNIATGGHDTVAVRVPSHPVARGLLSTCDFFVAAPSANKFGRVSPTTSQHVISEFGEQLLILDGEPSQQGVESTIISCIEDLPRILRSGSVTQENIAETLSIDINDISIGGDIAAPGNLEKHYAPAIPVFTIVEPSEATQLAIDTQRCAYLGLVGPTEKFKFPKVVNNENEFARELYSFFREAEDKACESIVVVEPPASGLGVAINDRLTKAKRSFSEVD